MRFCSLQINLISMAGQDIIYGLRKLGDKKVRRELDVVVEKYLAGIFHGMFCNRF